MTDFLTALGLVFFIEGLPYFLAPGQMRAWAERLARLPEPLLRRTGLAFMLTGVGIVYLVRG
ncbi:MAG: DUF2065 domain-containing protein [Magnetococcus sp. WYHC-3]